MIVVLVMTIQLYLVLLVKSLCAGDVGDSCVNIGDVDEDHCINNVVSVIFDVGSVYDTGRCRLQVNRADHPTIQE